MTADIIARAAEMFGDPFMPVAGIGEDQAMVIIIKIIGGTNAGNV